MQTMSPGACQCVSRTGCTRYSTSVGQLPTDDGITRDSREVPPAPDVQISRFWVGHMMRCIGLACAGETNIRSVDHRSKINLQSWAVKQSLSGSNSRAQICLRFSRRMLISISFHVRRPAANFLRTFELETVPLGARQCRHWPVIDAEPRAAPD